MTPDIRELFDDAADDSGRSQLDATRLVAKGRRKVRIRRAGAVAGSAVLVAAAAVGVSQLQTLTSGGPVPPANTPTLPTVAPTPPTVAPTPPTQTSPANTVTSPAPPTSQPTSQAPASSPTERTPRDRSVTGAEVIRKLTYDEGVRRCQQRLRAEKGEPGTPNPGEPIDVGQGLQYGMYVTDLLPMKLRDGSETYCSVPGPTPPGYDVGSPSDDPKEACGQLTWLDLTRWSVTHQVDGQGGFAMTLMSPDRKAVLLCDRDGPGTSRERHTAFPNAYVFLVYGPASGERVGGAPNGPVGSGLDSTPIHFLGAVKGGRQFWGGGGIAKSGAVRYALYAGTRKLTEVPVENGLYAMRIWLPAASGEPTQVRAYNASGTVIDQYQPF